MSDPSSASSSSSSSSSDSSTSSILLASAWNHQKATQPIKGHPILQPPNNNSRLTKEQREEQRNHPLLQPRRYNRNDSLVAATEEEEEIPKEIDIKEKEEEEQKEKTELESAVILDYLSTNSLFTHLPHQNLLRLVNTGFTKCKYRNHEIIHAKGDDARYLYLLYSSEVSSCSEEEGKDNGDGSSKYVTLGELEILTGTTHTQTVSVTSPTATFFRLDSTSFHNALKPHMETTAEERLHYLENSIPSSMVDIFPKTILQKLCAKMELFNFFKHDVLVAKETTHLDSLVVIIKGKVVATDVTMAGRSYEDIAFGPGETKTSFGWQSILEEYEDEQHHHTHFQGKIVAQSDGTALILNKSAFQTVLGGEKDLKSSLYHLAARRLAKHQLQRIDIFRDSELEEQQIEGLLDIMHHCEYISPSTFSLSVMKKKDGENGNVDKVESKIEKEMTIFKAGEKIDAAMYFVREGSVTLIRNKGESKETIKEGGYFGEGNMLRDQNKDGTKHYIIRSPMTAVANGPRAVLDVLYLEECRSVVNTKVLGLAGGGGSLHMVNHDLDDVETSFIKLDDIERHTLLGTGCFGQVWMASMDDDSDGSKLKVFSRVSSSFDEKRIASNECSNNEETTAEKEEGEQQHKHKHIVALKVQAKYEVIQAEKADRVVAERNILASLHDSPFILQLYHAFQDKSRLYMITSLCQGGELSDLIPEDGGLSENDARFYAAGILEGLTYMHRRHIVHRDIKPGNILLNEKGYPVIIDFGFAKYVPDKTYTFCGSPFFIAPEIIRYKGHDKSCDIWS